MSVAESRRQALLLDLDGTVYRGDGPVLAYARHLNLPPLLSTMVEFLRDGSQVPDATDGWEAVQFLAADHGVDQATMDAAFLASRAALARPDCDIDLPPDLLPLLRELRPTTYLLLATNSPPDWLDHLLGRLGVADLLDDVVARANKPTGMPAILRSLADRIDATDRPWRILSVGDHWRNDIAPARDFGAVTGYIDRFGRADGPADAVAPTFEGVLPAIRRWAGDPDTFEQQRAASGEH